MAHDRRQAYPFLGPGISRSHGTPVWQRPQPASWRMSHPAASSAKACSRCALQRSLSCPAGLMAPAGQWRMQAPQWLPYS
jgi:hypothetical protein